MKMDDMIKELRDEATCTEEHCEHCDTWTEKNHSTCVHHRICKTCMDEFGQCIECRKVIA